MTAVTDTTMASSEAADSSFKPVECKNRSKQLKAAPEQKIVVKRTHKFTVHAYFPPLPAKTKFNPITSMRGLLVELLKHEPSIAIASPLTRAQLIQANNQIPTSKEEFKNFFMILTDNCTTMQQQESLLDVTC